MEAPVTATVGGTVVDIVVTPGDQVGPGQVLVIVEPAAVTDGGVSRYPDTRARTRRGWGGSAASSSPVGGDLVDDEVGHDAGAQRGEQRHDLVVARPRRTPGAGSAAARRGSGRWRAR